jgi:hypothetical protein
MSYRLVNKPNFKRKQNVVGASLQATHRLLIRNSAGNYPCLPNPTCRSITQSRVKLLWEKRSMAKKDINTIFPLNVYCFSENRFRAIRDTKRHFRICPCACAHCLDAHCVLSGVGSIPGIILSVVITNPDRPVTHSEIHFLDFSAEKLRDNA